MFGRLRDVNGDTIQLVDNNEPSLIKSLKQESAITVRGNIAEQVKPDGSKSFDLIVEEVQVLNESGVIGSQLSSETKEWPPQYRYLQLRSTEFQQRLQRRAKIMSISRSVLDGLNFTEVETPLLFKSTPEGAREFLVPTRKKGYTYALPQSPQQYKQLLMASGVHRYYQIARCFRDEDLRADRQPEFTQLDMEMSFANGEDVQKVIEKLAQKIWKEVLNKRFYTLDGDTLVQVEEGGSFNKLLYDEAIARFGIDKPDLRSSLEIVNVSEFATSVENPNYPVFEVMILRSGASNAELVTSLLNSSEYSARNPTVVAVENVSKWHEGFANVEFSNLSGLNAMLNLEVGDLVVGSSRQVKNYENPTPLGRARQIAISKTLTKGIYVRKTLGSHEITASDFVGSWVVEFPLFNPIELEGSGNEKVEDNRYPVYASDRYISTHHPFTMAHLDDYSKLETDPLQVRGQHYDFVVNGVELGGGSTRVHDVDLQKYIFANILQIKDPEALFGHLLTAFSTGCPPHAGLAIGFDRMTAMLCGTESIRDVIAFPKTITGADPLIGSPSKVTPSQLKEYHVKVC